MAPLQVCGGTKNPIRVSEINNIVVLLNLMLVPPHASRGATAIFEFKFACFADVLFGIVEVLSWGNSLNLYVCIVGMRRIFNMFVNVITIL